MPSTQGPTLTRILHPCILLRQGTSSLLVDPCFGHFTRRRLTRQVFGVSMPPPGIEPEALPPLSVLLITHGHEDHLDARALQRLPSREAQVFTAQEAVARRMRALGFRSADRLPLWETVSVPGWEITAVPARSLNAPREVSWIVRAGAVTIFHGGDTAFHGSFETIRQRFAPDVACLPVNGVALLGVRLTMTPPQAAEAARRLGVRVALPMHEEMSFTRLSGLLYRAPGTAQAFETELRKAAPGIRAIHPRRGEGVCLGEILEAPLPRG